MAELQNDRWQTRENDFAVRLELNDVEGLFSKKVIIEPGTRALFLEQGRMIGEVPPGEHTLQSVMARLMFWTKKSTVVILTRGEEVLLDLECSGLPTKELLDVEIKLKLAVRMEDVALFFKNVMTVRTKFTTDDLRSAISPIVHQALHEATGRLSIRDLMGDQARGDLEAAVSQALGSSLSRDGLGFGRIQTLSVSHPRYDEHRRLVGNIWLQGLELEREKSANKVELDRLLSKIEQRENLGDLEILAQHVDTDRLEKDLEAKKRRVGIRKQWRAAILADKFDEGQFEDDQARFELIRKDEFETLKKTLNDKDEDRQKLRQHLVAKLDNEQAFDLESLRSSLDFEQKKRSKQHEINLAILSDTEEAKAWKAHIELEMQRDADRHAQDLKRLEYARLQGTGQRADELAAGRHKLELDRIHGELEIAQAERKRRKELIDAEVERSRLDDTEARERRARERQIETWKEVRSTKHQHKIETIQAHRGMSATELMAVSDNAAVIADVEKTRATSAEVEQLRAKLEDAHKTASQGTIAALQQALQSQQSLVDSMTRNLAPQPGSTVVVSEGTATRIGGAAPGGTQGRVIVCISCRADNEVGDRFCRQCGKSL